MPVRTRLRFLADCARGIGSARARACIAALGFALAAAGAPAGEFAVSPLRVDLAPGQRTQLLALTNNGKSPARFLARSASWTMNAGGGVDLGPDTELLVFPSSFTVAPGGTQNIRVGTRAAPADAERTWRVVLEELPGAGDATGTTVQVLSMLSVPVFLPATRERHDIELGLNGRIDGARASGFVANKGNTHEMLARLSLVALAGTKPLETQSQEGWYVLPGLRRVYPFEAARDWCALGADRFELRMADREGQVLGSTSVDAREACR